MFLGLEAGNCRSAQRTGCGLLLLKFSFGDGRKVKGVTSRNQLTEDLRRHLDLACGVFGAL